MDTLPIELQNYILSFLSTHDLKAHDWLILRLCPGAEYTISEPVVCGLKGFVLDEDETYTLHPYLPGLFFAHIADLSYPLPASFPYSKVRSLAYQAEVPPDFLRPFNRLQKLTIKTLYEIDESYVHPMAVVFHLPPVKTLVLEGQHYLPPIPSSVTTLELGRYFYAYAGRLIPDSVTTLSLKGDDYVFRPSAYPPYLQSLHLARLVKSDVLPSTIATLSIDGADVDLMVPASVTTLILGQYFRSQVQFSPGLRRLINLSKHYQPEHLPPDLEVVLPS